jgi:predicted permease
MNRTLRELRWAWRGVLARGWRAIVIVLLFAVALAANAVVFSAADAFVFNIAPYHQPDRLAVIEGVINGVARDYTTRQEFLAWRNHRDLFAGVHGHEFTASAYVTVGGSTESLRAHQVTPGLFELVGVLPKWGRPLLFTDAAAGAPPVVVIGETLARRLYGSPERAVGQAFATGRGTPLVVGVMPATFRFPSAREEIWAPLDIDTWPGSTGIRNVVRLAEGQTMESAIAAVAARADAVSNVFDDRGRRRELRLRSLLSARRNDTATTVFSVLLGAAMCLLLIACANVASLETAAAARRVRAFAVQAALGASRASLVRAGLIEGGLMLIASAAAALLFAYWGMAALDRELTVAMRDALTNPLDLDGRTLAMMMVIAAATWLLTALPGVWRVSRASVVEALRDDPRVMPVSRASARSRQLLMTTQVALTVLLLVGALLYVQTYAGLVGRDKGFDAARIATIEIFQAPDAGRAAAAVEREVLERLRVMPGIRSVSRISWLPPSTGGGGTAPLTIDDGNPTADRIMIHYKDADPDYFTTMGIPIIEGRVFDPAGPRDEIVIDERFARMHFPMGSAIGSRYKLGSFGWRGIREFQIVGVARELRVDRLKSERNEDVFVAYMALPATSHPLYFVARMDDERRLAAIEPVVRAAAGRAMVRIDTVEARYARLDAESRLAAAITTGFGIVAFLVAVSGVYAVMAYLVAGRRREIGIRMALGADRGTVLRLVFGSALRFVAIGTALGLGAAAMATRAIAGQLYGVAAIHLPTYAVVAGLVVVAAAAATWWPARRAARIDPAITLRTE